MISSFKTIQSLVEKYFKCIESPQSDESLQELGVNLDAELTFRQIEKEKPSKAGKKKVTKKRSQTPQVTNQTETQNSFQLTSGHRMQILYEKDEEEEDKEKNDWYQLSVPEIQLKT